MTVSFEQSRHLSGTKEEIFGACTQAIKQAGFSLIDSDGRSSKLKARASASWRSFGEHISVSVDTDGTVDVVSRCILGATELHDMGKNQDNVSNFFQNLYALLPGAQTPLPHPALQMDPSSIEVTGKSNAAEYDEIVDFEDLPLDNRYGSHELTVEHEFSRTVENEITVGENQQTAGSVGLISLLGVQLSTHLSRELGYAHGETVTRRYTSRFTIGPGQSVIYRIVWKRRVLTGTYDVVLGGRQIAVPFTAKYSLHYEVTTRGSESE